jgi:hypothetical protein
LTADNRRPSSRKPPRRRAVRPAGAPPRAAAGPPHAAGRGRPRPGRQVVRPPARRTARGRFEALSARPLVLMSRLPRWLVPVVLAILLVAGLAIYGPLGAILLLVLGLFLGWLVFVSWPALPATTRIIRVVVVLGILGVAVLQVGR